MRPNPNIKFTYEDYLLLPDDKRYELIEGELYMMTPSPTWKHQDISKRIFLALNGFVVINDLGEVMYAPLDVIFSDYDVVEPDIIFISKERLHIIGKKFIHGAPDLLAEILSEGTRERDLNIKKKLYAKYGVKEYWVADPEEKAIHVMTLGKRGFNTFSVFQMGDMLTSPLLKGLQIKLEEVFV